jgi:hypothetical protein
MAGLEMAGCGGDHAFHLIGIERAGEDVKATDIQHLGPEVVVGHAGCDDQLRGDWQFAEVVQHFAPVPRGQGSFGDDDAYRIPFQGLEGRAAAGGLKQAPAALSEDLLKENSLIRKLAHQEGGNRHLTRIEFHSYAFLLTCLSFVRNSDLEWKSDVANRS